MSTENPIIPIVEISAPAVVSEIAEQGAQDRKLWREEIESVLQANLSQRTQEITTLTTALGSIRESLENQATCLLRMETALNQLILKQQQSMKQTSPPEIAIVTEGVTEVLPAELPANPTQLPPAEKKQKEERRGRRKI